MLLPRPRVQRSSAKQFIYDTLRFYSMSIADFLSEYFESDLIKCHLSGSGIIGSGAWASTRPARPTCCCTTTWATWTARSAPGASRAAAWAPCRGDRELVQVLRRRDRDRRAGRARAASQGRARHRRRDRERQRSTTPTSSSPTWIREAHLHSRSSTRRTCRRDRREGARTGRSAARPASSTSRSTGCRSSRRSARTTRSPTATCTSSIRSRRCERAYDDWKNGTWSKEPYLDLPDPVA